MTFFKFLSRPAALWLAALYCLPGAVAAQGAEGPAFGLIVGYRDGANELGREENDRGPWADGRERAQAVWQRAAQRSRERTQQLATDTGVKVKSVGEAGRSALMRFERVLKGAELEDAMRRVRLHPDVAWVEPDVLLKRQQTKEPNDSIYLSSQWHLKTSGPGAAAAMNHPAGWFRTTGSNVVVAVVDSGILAHPDLPIGLPRLLPGYDFVDDDVYANDGSRRDNDPTDPGDWVSQADKTSDSARFGSCDVADSSWHGTFIAGQIAALTDQPSAQGVAGINWAARILPVRVAGKCGAFLSDLVDGVRWAAGLPVTDVPTNNFPARVINLSFGGSASCSSTPLYQQMVDDVTNANALLVVAGGNNDGPVTRPADCVGVMAVGAVRRDGAKAWYSSFGSQITLSAPGGSNLDGPAVDHLIRSTDNPGLTTAISYTGMSDLNAYGYKQGTSFSAPQAAGVASLMLDINPHLTPAALIDRMKKAARPWSSVTPGVLTACGPAGAEACRCTDATCGAGLLDAAASVQLATGPAAIITPIGTVTPGTAITLNGSASVALTGSSIATHQWTQVSGPTVAITNASTAVAGASLPSSPATYVFRLTVTDDFLPTARTGSDTVTVVAAYPVTSGGGGGSTSVFWGLALWAWVLAVCWQQRRTRRLT
jgi:serine protease